MKLINIYCTFYVYENSNCINLISMLIGYIIHVCDKTRLLLLQYVHLHYIDPIIAQIKERKF